MGFLNKIVEEVVRLPAKVVEETVALPGRLLGASARGLEKGAEALDDKPKDG